MTAPVLSPCDQHWVDWQKRFGGDAPKTAHVPTPVTLDPEDDFAVAVREPHPTIPTKHVVKK